MRDLCEHTGSLASFHSCLVPTRAVACCVSLTQSEEGRGRHTMAGFAPWAMGGVFSYTQHLQQRTALPQPHREFHQTQHCNSCIHLFTVVCIYLQLLFLWLNLDFFLWVGSLFSPKSLFFFFSSLFSFSFSPFLFPKIK